MTINNVQSTEVVCNFAVVTVTPGGYGRLTRYSLLVCHNTIVSFFHLRDASVLVQARQHSL